MIAGIFPNLTKQEVFCFLPILTRTLSQKGFDWYVTDVEEEGLKSHHMEIAEDRFRPDDWIGSHADIVISLGGDGSFLQVASRMGDYPVQQLGIHLGDFGFLNSVTPDDLDSRLDDILEKNYDIEKRVFLAGRIERKNGEKEPLPVALNDIVAGHNRIGTMVRLDLSINNHYVERYAADGIIVSTPTGSTSYAMSCGGSVLHSSSDELLVVPICAHMMLPSPLVIPEGFEIKITVPEREKLIHVCVDGTHPYQLSAGDSLIIKGYQRRIRFIRFRDQDFFVNLARKFRRN